MYCLLLQFRHLGTLKKYVRNRARPEGSIVAGQLINEWFNFCHRYIQEEDMNLNRPRNDDRGDADGRYFGKLQYIHALDDITYVQAHRWVLTNTPEVISYQE